MVPHRRPRICPVCGKEDLKFLSDHIRQVHQLSSNERTTLLKSALYQGIKSYRDAIPFIKKTPTFKTRVSCSDTVKKTSAPTMLNRQMTTDQQPVQKTVMNKKVESNAVPPSGAENVNKLMNILRKYGYNPDESSSDEEAINWNAPL